jgi:DNA-binding NarL/FixJ family response regulator
VSKAIRVLLADDHPALRLGMRMLLDRAPDVEVVGEAQDGEEALAPIEELRPDVAVLDCKLPGLSGPEVAREIRRRGLPVRVLALSSYDDDRYVRGMLEAGAAGYLLKEEAPETIVAAVRGEGYFSPPVAAKIAAWARGELPGGLTGRELELSIVERTVGFHVSNILKKLEVTSRVEAAMWAQEQGIVS